MTIQRKSRRAGRRTALATVTQCHPEVMATARRLITAGTRLVVLNCTSILIVSVTSALTRRYT